MLGIGGIRQASTQLVYLATFWDAVGGIKMGIIGDLLQSADKSSEDLELHDYVSFEVFFNIMLLHCDDDYSVIAGYLSDSHEFKKLNYYEYGFDEKNDSWGMIKYSHDQIKDIEADNEMYEPIFYCLEDVGDNNRLRGYCSEYYFSIRELLLTDAIKKVGLTKEKFEFIYSALNLEFYEVHAILLENKRLKTLLANFKKSYKADGEIDLLEYVLESQERIDQLERELTASKKIILDKLQTFYRPEPPTLQQRLLQRWFIS